MPVKIITKVDLKNHWNITCESSEWKASLPDPQDPETGVIMATSYDFGLLIDKLEVFEKGQGYGDK